MYCKLFDNLRAQLPEETFEEFRNKTVHLGIFSTEHLFYIINGEQFLEARFTKNKISPYGYVNKGDFVVMKEACGPIYAYFVVDDVEYINIKEETTIEELEFKYNDELFQDDLFWKLKRHTNYATIIHIGKVTKLEPFRIAKTRRQGWVTLDKDYILD